MPRLKSRLPRIYQDRNRAYVKLDGKRVSLGRWQSDEAREVYDRVITEYLANGRKRPAPTSDNGPRTIAGLIDAYQLATIERSPVHPPALHLLRSLYGSEPITSFGPKRLSVVRHHLIGRGLAKATIVEYVRSIKTVFRWGVASELIEERTYRRLTTLAPLRSGEVTKETKRVRPVPRADVRRVRHLLTRPVRALTDLQLLTGARPGELLGLTSTAIDRSTDVWTYQPVKHKTAHHGHERTIYFGPRAQRILQLFMETGQPLDKPLFSPRESNAEAKRRGAKGQRRPNQRPSPVASSRVIGETYTVGSYRKAVQRACKRAKVNQWGPNRLRHNAATHLRRQFGLDVASVILGHSTLAVTATYAELNDKKARDVMARVG